MLMGGVIKTMTIMSLTLPNKHVVMLVGIDKQPFSLLIRFLISIYPS